MLHRLASSALCLSLLALACSTFALACSSDAPPSSETGAAAAEPAAPTATPSVEGPKITCADAVHEFGAVGPNTSVEHVFTIKNEGSEDLKIERIQKT